MMTRTLAVSLCFVALAACASAEPTPSSEARAVLGEALPLEAPRLAGGEAFTLEALRGQVVIVDFWASWCEPCRAAMPHYAALRERHQARGLAVVTVSVDETIEAARRFAAEVPMPFEVLWDEGTKNAQRWPVEAMPTAFLVDRQGRARTIYLGFTPATSARLERELEALLAEP